MLLAEKICNTCKILKKSNEFYLRKQTNNLQGDCKVCYQEKKRKIRAKKIENGFPRYVAKKKKCIDCENLCDARKKISRCYSCENKLKIGRAHV